MEGRKDTIIHIRDLTLDTEKSTISFKGKVLPFTNKEYIIMELLIRKEGKVLTKEFLLNYLYNGIDEPDAKIIDVFIHKIRKKMLDQGITEDIINRHITTIWGRGYMFCE